MKIIFRPGRRPETVDIDLVGVFVVHGSGDREVLADAACRSCVAEIITDLGGSEARINMRLVGAYKGIPQSASSVHRIAAASEK